MIGRPYRVVLIPAAMLAAFAVAFQVLGLRINVTPSIPLGVYVRTSELPRAGLIAEFCPAGMSAHESARYRGFGLACSDWAIPLLKPVVANEGDDVEFGAGGITVNGLALPNTSPRDRDSSGRPLHGWSAERARVKRGNVVVASTHHPGSYDSRYFGPIPSTQLLSCLRPLWILR